MDPSATLGMTVRGEADESAGVQRASAEWIPRLRQGGQSESGLRLHGERFTVVGKQANAY